MSFSIKFDKFLILFDGLNLMDSPSSPRNAFRQCNKKNSHTQLGIKAKQKIKKQLLFDKTNILKEVCIQLNNNNNNKGLCNFSICFWPKKIFLGFCRDIFLGYSIFDGEFEKSEKKFFYLRDDLF